MIISTEMTICANRNAPPAPLCQEKGPTKASIRANSDTTCAYYLTYTIEPNPIITEFELLSPII
jgi:hypothetical protein